MENKDSYLPQEVARFMDVYSNMVQIRSVLARSQSDNRTDTIVRKELRPSIDGIVNMYENGIPENIRAFLEVKPDELRKLADKS